MLHVLSRRETYSAIEAPKGEMAGVSDFVGSYFVGSHRKLMDNPHYPYVVYP